MEQAEVIKTLLDSVLHLKSKLEAMESCTPECKVAESKNQWKEDYEAYMQKLEEEDVETWTEMLECDEDGSGEASAFPTPPSF